LCRAVGTGGIPQRRSEGCEKSGARCGQSKTGKEPCDLQAVGRNGDGAGRRAFNGEVELFQNDPHWRDLLLFNEYFHGEDGRGVGASHQTGWSATVAKMINQLSRYPAP